MALGSPLGQFSLRGRGWDIGGTWVWDCEDFDMDDEHARLLRSRAAAIMLYLNLFKIVSSRQVHVPANPTDP
jgi:hypothetical protein